MLNRFFFWSTAYFIQDTKKLQFAAGTRVTIIISFTPNTA